MTFRGFRIPVVMAVLAVTLGVLLSANHLYRRETETAPLVRRSMAIEGVTGVTLRRSGSLVVIELALASVEDLRTTFRAAESAAEDAMSRERVRLVLVDRRTSRLANAYHRVHYVIYEAAARGTYSQLGDVETTLAGEGWRARVSVDDRFIYVQIHDGSGGYLYELVPLPRAGDEGAFRLPPQAGPTAEGSSTARLVAPQLGAD